MCFLFFFAYKHYRKQISPPVQQLAQLATLTPNCRSRQPRRRLLDVYAHSGEWRSRASRTQTRRHATHREYKLAGLHRPTAQFVHCLAIDNTHRLLSSPTDRQQTKMAFKVRWSFEIDQHKTVQHSLFWLTTRNQFCQSYWHSGSSHSQIILSVCALVAAAQAGILAPAQLAYTHAAPLAYAAAPGKTRRPGSGPLAE